LACLCISANPVFGANAAETGSGITFEQTGRDRGYTLDREGCSYSVWIFAERIEGNGEALHLRLSGDCLDRALAKTIDSFGELLRAVDGAEPKMRQISKISFPRVDEVPHLLVRTAIAAQNSTWWEKSVARSKPGAANAEVAKLINEADVYAEFEGLLGEFGVAVSVTSAEKAFLASVADILQRPRSREVMAGLRQLPPELLVPDTAIIYFERVANSTEVPMFGVYSNVEYIDEEDAGDLIGDEIHLINTGKTAYVVYLSFEGGSAVPILAKAHVEGNALEFSLEEKSASLVTFRGRIDGCMLTGAFFYPHERKVKFHRESADCR
jgi:hypothetical protein